jgi:hypothetical protein
MFDPLRSLRPVLALHLVPLSCVAARADEHSPTFQATDLAPLPSPVTSCGAAVAD